MCVCVCVCNYAVISCTVIHLCNLSFSQYHPSIYICVSQSVCHSLSHYVSYISISVSHSL